MTLRLLCLATFLLASHHILCCHQEKEHEYLGLEQPPGLSVEMVAELKKFIAVKNLDDIVEEEQIQILKLLRNALCCVFGDNFVQMLEDFGAAKNKIKELKEIILDAQIVNEFNDRFKMKIKRIGLDQMLSCLTYWDHYLKIYYKLKQESTAKRTNEDVIEKLCGSLKNKLSIDDDDELEMAENRAIIAFTRLIPGLSSLLSEND